MEGTVVLRTVERVCIWQIAGKSSDVTSLEGWRGVLTLNVLTDKKINMCPLLWTPGRTLHHNGEGLSY